MSETSKALKFTAILCISCSLLLSGTAILLKDRQQTNEALDQKRNILKVFGVDLSNKKTWSRDQIEAVYAQHVTETTSAGKTLFIWNNEGVRQFAFPISGPGLWGDIYGYIALKSDLETVAGITFYKHEETPGLGGEIGSDDFCRRFIGKKLFAANGVPTDFWVRRPGEAASEHDVDGISGATLTSQGVQNLLHKNAAAYAQRLKQIREADHVAE